MIIKELQGHSGCNVSLHSESSGERFVRKISPNAEYNNRLNLQMKKQEKFKSSEIHVPDIIEYGYIEDLFYFDMEFIKGESLHEYISKNSSDNISNIFSKIESYFKNYTVLEEKDCRDIIENKVNTTLEKISLKDRAEFEKYREFIVDNEWSKIPITAYCHGDMTFENIIVSKNSIYLIDFLDTYESSILLDASKMLQDVLYFWSWRNYQKKSISKNMYILDKLDNIELFIRNKEIIRALVVLDILRIIPYTKNENTRNYLKLCLERSTSRRYKN